MAVVGLGFFYLSAIVGIPTVTGVGQGVSHQQKQNEEAANDFRMVKFHIDVFCEAKSTKRRDVHGTMVVVKDGKLWLVPKDKETNMPIAGAGHPFTGFFITYPDDNRDAERGLVSTISEDPPMLNWIYVDKDTLEVKHGNRTGSIEHIVGEWDWTEDMAGIMLEDWEGFVAVEEEEGIWALYFDKHDNGLDNGKKVGGKPVLQCSLERRVFSDEQQKAENEMAQKKLEVKKTGDLTTTWG
ncbi:hypothetical protein K402DRAFT_331901 [Aulographum hederae CBS 113979]|uniref:Uncharacterized protein n=1 Tax=Aulographum hederae CBS 113979 TaxID=1176131 RepID=A0A6G1H128_9PEZI|nr:hypothetical protein K402DRAFT_331901 [Aulographum hederae CBS 113979]